jgi:pilus assembly protein CpaC
MISQAGSLNVTQWEDEIYLVQGEIASIGVASPRRVAVANPAIADIDKVGKDEVIVVGKGVGDTVLVIWDKLGQRSLSIKVVSENLDYLKARIEQLLLDHLQLKETLIRINQSEGKIVLLGRIRPEQEKAAQMLLEPFSGKIINLIKTTEDALVQIDVQILELSKDATDILGVDWLDYMNITEQPVSGTSTLTTGGVATTLNRTGTFGEIVRVVEMSRDALNAKINFLTTRGKGRVLSRPKLVCLSGKEAQLLVGGNVPIVTTNTTSSTVTSNVSYQPYGITLKIQPVVTEEGQVNAKLSAEVSEVDTARSVTTTTTNAPAFATRNVSTELLLRDGQTVFLAGLIKNKDTTTLNKVPALADVPIIGALFRSKNFVTGETELVISLTPTVIRQGLPIRSVVEEKAVLPAATAVEPADPVIQYSNEVQKVIAQAIYYPVQAKDAGWEGKVDLKLHLQSDGTLRDVNISRTSGYQIFDNTATSVVKKLSPYPPFPATIKSDNLWVEVPVVFQKD